MEQKLAAYEFLQQQRLIAFATISALDEGPEVALVAGQEELYKTIQIKE